LRIKKLELVGFKSFKDRTVIQFDAGITGVVGPNGCGKSNIVDALVWVMGEMSAKDLRGSSMTDVIFAGAEGYSPLGMCEVSLTLENDGGPFPAQYAQHSEIMVTRRLHRSGEGEYFINKEPARLKDVQEIFMDTGAGSKGFSIIQQGMIGKIITAKPEDRKHLIEEAAGITKFKARKKESQRKLQATDQNLIRLQDIIGELKRQIDSLQRQSQRAERYRNLKNQIEDLDLWISSRQYFDLKQAADEAQKIFNEAQAMEMEGESDFTSLQAQFEELKLELLTQEKSLETLQSDYYEKQSQTQKKEMELQELRFEIEQARRNEVMTGTLLQEQKARQALLLRDQTQLQEQESELKSEAESLSSQFEEKNHLFKNHESIISEADLQLTQTRREFFALGQTESSVDARVQSLQSQIEQISERETEEQMTMSELREKQIEFEGRRKKVFNELEKDRQLQLDLGQDVDSFEANKKILSEQLHLKRHETELFKDELNQVTSRLYGLENLQSNFEGFEEGVKNVMLWQKTKAQASQEVMVDGSVVTHFQPVSEVVEVPQKYEVAMEAALGSRLQMLLSDKHDQSLQAVQFLKEQQSGRSSFLSEEASSAVHFSSSPAGEDGVEELLKNVVQAGEKHKQAVSYLLDGVAVVDSLRTALALRPKYQGWSFVTLDGDTLSSDGVLTGGGSQAADTGVLKRQREIKELSALKDEWSGKLALAQASMRKIEEQLNNVVNDFEGAQKRKIEQEIKVRELKKDLERAEQELANAGSAVERQDREMMKIQEQKQSLQLKCEELATTLQDARLKKQEIQSLNEALERKLNETQNGFDELRSTVTDLQVRAASKSQEHQGLLRQLEMVNKSLAELDLQLSRMQEESENSNIKMTEGQLILEERKIEFERFIVSVEEAKKHVSAANEKYEVLATQSREIESRLQSSQKARHERQSRMNESQLKLEQAKLKEQYLIDQVLEKYRMDLAQVYGKYIEQEKDLATSEAELKDLRDKLSRIGEVNLSAIQEYEETAKRYEFLTQQHNDLTEAKEQLKKVIDRINRICTKRFKETFDLVNDRFTRVFPVLFGGGEAKLELHENLEKGEMGIEIVAKPPGKKMQNVTLMSGGEKALTAVALVFSIFLVKPSPYCLLDEVDAPLDDANVHRFNDLVREMSKRSQIIVVTHNKHTMEVVKKLYGVTMQERGVSTMVSVNLEDAQK
jgi:chromosome segregation protein